MTLCSLSAQRHSVQAVISWERLTLHPAALVPVMNSFLGSPLSVKVELGSRDHPHDLVSGIYHQLHRRLLQSTTQAVGSTS